MANVPTKPPPPKVAEKPAKAPNAPVAIPHLTTGKKAVAAEPLHITLHGPPGHGKTWCACSASKHWASKEPLSDLFYVGLDAGGLRGVVEAGYDLPYVFDVPGYLRGNPKVNVLQCMETVARSARELYDKADVKTVVVDTVSTMDLLMQSVLEPNTPIGRNGKPDKFAFYRLMLGAHTKIFWELLMLPMNVLFCCHTKALVEGDSDDTANKNRAAAVPGPDTTVLVPQITGQALNLYTGAVDLEASIHASPLAGAPGKYTRWVHITPTAGFRSKNRLQLSLADKEPPNMFDIFKKIKGDNV